MPLYHWTNQIKSVFSNLSKPQATVLAAFSFGVAKAKSRPLNAITRGLAFLGIPDTVETRLRRFISNPRIDMAESCKSLALSLGAKVCLSPKIHRAVAVGRNVNGANVFRLGLPLFQNRLSERRRIPCALKLPTGLRAAKKLQGSKRSLPPSFPLSRESTAPVPVLVKAGDCGRSLWNVRIQRRLALVRSNP